MNLKERIVTKKNDVSEAVVNPPFPRIIKIDFCNTCNYSCIFCPACKQTGRKGFIDRDLCLRVLEDAYRAGARQLGLSMTGESLLNKDLEEYVRFAKKLGYEYIFLNTNGFFCDRARGLSLLECGINSIKFSINADKRMYQLIHGIDGYERVIANLEALYESRESLQVDCKIYISYIAIKQSLDEAEILREKTKNCCDEFLVMNATRRAGSISEIDGGLYIEGTNEYGFHYPCSQMFNSCNVTAEGYMIVCCEDFENMTVVADLHEEDIVSAWNNAVFTEYRRRHLDGQLEGSLCYNCLNNTNEPVIPARPDCAGHKESRERKANLDRRIRQILQL